ncbi:hypothetical protein, partial [Chryseobacterium binzhouense]|uniref:hypothetical protein n=1 Tax=Chryseobacterium binzhouense TaxID=2593646 RepID=UPI001E28F209
GTATSGRVGRRQFLFKPHTQMYEVFLCPFIPPFLLLCSLFFILYYCLTYNVQKLLKQRYCRKRITNIPKKF